MHPSNNSVEVILEGGLGNQLFGWAAGYSLSKKTNATLILNTSQLYQHGFQLDSFKLDEYSVNTKQDRKISKRLRLNQPTDFREKSFRYDSRIENLKNNVILKGYYQSWKYSKDVISDVQNMVRTIRNPTLEFKNLFEEIRNKKSLAIHIRRGDYVGLQDYHGLISSRYYHDALKVMKWTMKPEQIVVFSDDIVEAKKVFPNADIFISANEIKSPAENLVLMSNCHSIIGANSSFSLWAAMVNQADEAQFIFPRPWFTEDSLDTRDLLPDNFLTLGR